LNLELISYPILLVLFTALFTIEVIAPVSKNSCDMRWLLIASVIGLAQMVVSLVIGYVFRDWFNQHALFNVSGKMPSVMVGLSAFFITGFFFYWWHRLTHVSDLLWRLIHQLHHSSQRIESITAFYAHPLESGFASLLSCFSAYLILGASAQDAAWAIFFTGLFNFYVHSDTKSPRWLGYIIQRPEMHRLHHKRNHHAQNYGLPIFDMLFGTFCNPKEDPTEFGFSDERSARVTDMLKGIDVHKR